MASGRSVGQRPDCHTFLCKFWHFQMAVSQWKLARLTANLGILWISVSFFWLCESIVANPIIYRLVPGPSRFEIRQWSHRQINSELFYYQSAISCNSFLPSLRSLPDLNWGHTLPPSQNNTYFSYISWKISLNRPSYFLRIVFFVLKKSYIMCK